MKRYLILYISLLCFSNFAVGNSKITIKNPLNVKEWVFINSAKFSDEFDWDYYLDSNSLRAINDTQFLYVSNAVNKGSSDIKSSVSMIVIDCSNFTSAAKNGYRERFRADGQLVSTYGNLSIDNLFEKITSNSAQEKIASKYCPKISTFARMSRDENISKNLLDSKLMRNQTNQNNQNLGQADKMTEFLESNPPGLSVPYCAGATIFIGAYFGRNQAEKNNMSSQGGRIAKFGNRFHPQSEARAGQVAVMFTNEYGSSTNQQERKKVESKASWAIEACIPYLKKLGFSL